MWACLQAYGDAGYGARVTHSANLAIHFEQRIKASDGAFVLSHPRSFVNVCFWWVPPALRPFQPAKASQQDLATLSKVGVCNAESACRACQWVLRVLLQHCFLGAGC